MANLAQTGIWFGGSGVIRTSRKRGEDCCGRDYWCTGRQVRGLRNRSLDHEGIAIAMAIMAIPTELTAILGSIVLCPQMIQTNFHSTILKGCLNRHTQ